MVFWITSHMRTKRKRVDEELVIIRVFKVLRDLIIKLYKEDDNL